MAETSEIIVTSDWMAESDLLDADDLEINDEPEEVAIIEVQDDAQEPDIVFMLDPVPGAPIDQEIELSVDDDGDIEVKDSDEIEIDEDPWDWSSKGLSNFLQWLNQRLQQIPQHSGYDTTGLEKTKAYLEYLDKEISKAMRQDFKNEIDHGLAERAREQIEGALERLEERYNRVKSEKYRRHAKKKKSSLDEFMMIKEASRGERIGGIVITVPLLISRLARTCINGTGSSGHDIEDMFEKLAKEYNLDKRERAELAQLLDDMNYPVNVDRGFPPGEPVDRTRSDNYDFNANYYA
jgi:hypothetical protein